MTPQWSHALDAANAVRTARAQIRRHIRDAGRTEGLRRAAHIITDPPDCVHAVPVLDFLTWTPSIGRVRAIGITRRVEVGVSMTVGGITPRQREGLAEELALIADGVRAASAETGAAA